MNTEKTSHPATAEVQLLGHKIVLRTSDNDPEFAAEVIELVSARLEAVEKRLKGHKIPHQVTLLALLDLAEEYVRAKKGTADFKAEVETRSDELFRALGNRSVSSAEVRSQVLSRRRALGSEQSGFEAKRWFTDSFKLFGRILVPGKG